MSNSKNEKLIISGSALWAKVHNPTPPGDYKQVYEIDIVVDKATAKSLHAKGVNISKAKDLESIPAGLRGQPCVKAKTNYIKRDGSTAEPPRVVDSYKQPMTEEIGNGSKVNVAVTLVPYNKSGNSGIYVALNAVQVTELVAYSRDPFDVVDGGFTTAAEATSLTNEEAESSEEDLPF